MIERIDVGELPFRKIFLYAARIESWMTRIYASSTSSFLSLSSI